MFFTTERPSSFKGHRNHRRESMSWIALAFSAALSWGLYGASLHRGQVELGNPMKAMLCVGVAYFLIAVLVPVGGAGVARRAAELQPDRHGNGDAGRRARRARRRVHHLCVSRRRHAVHRDAAGVRRRADRQRAGVDGDSPAEGGAKPDAVSRLPAGRGRRGHGAVFPSARLRPDDAVEPAAILSRTACPPLVSLPCNG